MSPQRKHERHVDLLGRFVIVLTEELGLPISSGRSTTYRKRRKKRGLEPDNSYWIANEEKVRNKDQIDLTLDPPPDLAHEVDVTKSSLNRMAIYAALAVPEVWREVDDVLSFHVLDAGGKYHESTESRAFPGLRPGDLQAFLAQVGQMDENALVRKFREWVRQRITAGWKATTISNPT